MGICFYTAFLNSMSPVRSVYRQAAITTLASPHNNPASIEFTWHVRIRTVLSARLVTGLISSSVAVVGQKFSPPERRGDCEFQQLTIPQVAIFHLTHNEGLTSRKAARCPPRHGLQLRGADSWLSALTTKPQIRKEI